MYRASGGRTFLSIASAASSPSSAIPQSVGLFLTKVVGQLTFPRTRARLWYRFKDLHFFEKLRKEAWSFYRTSSGVRLCWELEKPKGPKGRTGTRCFL